VTSLRSGRCPRSSPAFPAPAFGRGRRFGRDGRHLGCRRPGDGVGFGRSLRLLLDAAFSCWRRCPGHGPKRIAWDWAGRRHHGRRESQASAAARRRRGRGGPAAPGPDGAGRRLIVLGLTCPSPASGRRRGGIPPGTRPGGPAVSGPIGAAGDLGGSQRVTGPLCCCGTCPPLRRGFRPGCRLRAKNRRESALCATPTITHESRSAFVLRRIGRHRVLSMLPPPPSSSQLFIVVLRSRPASTLRLLATATATITRTSAISARERIFRIGCTFTTSHAGHSDVLPGAAVFSFAYRRIRCFRRKHPSAKSVVGPA